jgi:hypothetical protein
VGASSFRRALGGRVDLVLDVGCGEQSRAAAWLEKSMDTGMSRRLKTMKTLTPLSASAAPKCWRGYSCMKKETRVLRTPPMGPGCAATWLEMARSMFMYLRPS